MTHRLRHARQEFLRIFGLSMIVILPLAPSVAQLTFHRDRCYAPTPPELKETPADCLIGSAGMAPLVLIFGGIALDEDPRPQLWRETAIAAVMMSIFTAMGWSLQRMTSRNLRNRKQNT